MKKRVLLAALAAAVCVTSGCSFKKGAQELTQEESTAQPETTVTQVQTPSTAQVPETSGESSPEQPQELEGRNRQDYNSYRYSLSGQRFNRYADEL